MKKQIYENRARLELLRQGLSAPDVLKRLRAEDNFEGSEGRQVAIVDAKGNIAVHTGAQVTRHRR